MLDGYPIFTIGEVSIAVRLPPLEPDQLDAEQRTALGRFAARTPLDNIFATFIRHPRLFEPYAVFGMYIFDGSSLDARRRELAILRVAARTNCAYERAQHLRFAQRSGLTDEEIDAVASTTSDVSAWPVDDGWVLQAVDELLTDHVIGDETWRGLESSLSEHQLIDLVFTIGTYCMIAFALNSFGVPIDDRFTRGAAAR